MKPKKLFLDHLVSETKSHTLRVTCVHKYRVTENERKVKRRQLQLQDEKGNEMKALIFGLNVAIFDPIIEFGGTYEMSNILVRDVKSIALMEQALHTLCTNVLKDIPRSPDPDARFYISAVVLHVQPPKITNSARAPNSQVTESYIIDDSSDDTILLSAWFDLALPLYAQLKDSNTVDHVISFTVLRVSDFKGFSLGTTPSSECSTDGGDERSVFLKEWCKTNKESIQMRKSDVKNRCTFVVAIQNVSISDALSKKVGEIDRGCQLKISACIDPFDVDEIKFSVGCANCGRNCNVKVAEAFTCVFCSQKTTASPKLFLNFKARDKSGSITLSAYTQNLEKFLKVTAVELHLKNVEQRDVLIKNAILNLSKEPTYMVIGLVSSLLSGHGIIKWALKDVVTP